MKQRTVTNFLDSGAPAVALPVRAGLAFQADPAIAAPWLQTSVSVGREHAVAGAARVDGKPERVSERERTNHSVEPPKPSDSKKASSAVLLICLLAGAV